jgi:UDP-N-acetylmuramoyl-L-alanyl-D-glutamate--2,6-diaminopimelate ligase
LPNAKFVGCRDLLVSGCSADSRRLDPGQVFVAVRGARHDGHHYVQRALERGAVGVVVEQPCPEAGRLQVVVPNSREAYAILCQALAGEPAGRLPVFGVAGSSGRTAAALFLRSILESSGARFGLVGAQGWSDGVQSRPAGAEEPRPEQFAEMLLAMAERGCAGGIVEISAAALERRLFDGITFETAVITDQRTDPGETDEVRMDRRRSHARLCRMVMPGGATVVNSDDRESELLGAANLAARRVAFGMHGAAEVTAEIERQDAESTRFRIRGFDREAQVELPFVGPHTVSAALAAAAVAWSRGIAADDVVAGLQAVAHVPGALEPVREGQPFAVWVDRVSSDAELSDALDFMRQTCSGQIHCVLDANVDVRERRGFAKVAELKADRVVLSIADPRVASPDAILDDVLAGFRRPGRIRVIPDRQAAIEAALELAVADDAVLIAGRGHRTILMLDRRPFARDDRSIAADWLRRNRFAPRRRSA